MPGRNILHNEPPSKSVAAYLNNGSRAFVETRCGKVFSYDNTRPKGQRFKEEALGFHPGFFMQPALSRQLGNPVLTVDPGEYPFTDFENLMELKSRTYEALTFFLHSLNIEFEPADREMYARKATHLLKEDAVRAEVEPVLIRNPMPPNFDTTYGPKEDHAGRILQAMIETWRPADPNEPREYAVSFRRGKKIHDLAPGDGALLVDYLRAQGIEIVEIMQTQEMVIVKLTVQGASDLYDAIHATCHVVLRTTGTVKV